MHARSPLRPQASRRGVIALSARMPLAHRLEAVAGGVPPSTSESAGASSEALPAAIAALIGPARYHLWFHDHTRFLCPGTEVIAGEGMIATPGGIDTHIHLFVRNKLKKH